MDKKTDASPVVKNQTITINKSEKKESIDQKAKSPEDVVRKVLQNKMKENVSDK